jgi:hypothetical protein
MIDDINERGSIQTKRIYGDFSGTQNKGWERVCESHLIDAYQVWNSRKQSADMRLIADGIDMIHSYPEITHLAVASGDIDVSNLIRIAKRHNKTVIGYSSNAQGTSERLKTCCDEYIILNDDQDEFVQNKKRKLSMDRSQLRQQVFHIIQNHEGKMMCSRVKEILLRKDSSFTEKNYGCKGFGELLRQLDFQVVKEKTTWLCSI